MSDSHMTLEFFIDWFKSDLNRFSEHIRKQPWFDPDEESMTWEQWEDEFNEFMRVKK